MLTDRLLFRSTGYAILLSVASKGKASSRVADVLCHLREAIYDGRLTPGTALRELPLARELQVSQATIREALQKLERSGLVTRRENLGTFVTRLSPKDIRERLALRVILEVTAARAAAERMTEEDFKELERRLEVLGRSVESDHYYAAAHADLDFHRYVWTCSGNETLCAVLEQVTAPLFAFISVMRSHDLHRLHDVVASHTPLIEALRSRDVRVISEAFERGATASYEPFLKNGDPLVAATAYGFLEPRG
jgi:DNA-binding GntR family transcriptional regulator